MRFKACATICFLIYFGTILPACAADGPELIREKTTETAKKESSLPSAISKESRYEFDPVMEGTVITHDFIIENTGDAPLIISKVKTSCGCTTASYTKQIAPASQGTISIKGHTAGYGGRTFSKVITVYTNDLKHEQLKLYLYGQIESFAMIEPKRVVLWGMVGNEIQTQVTIIPLKKYPFHIVSSHADNLEDRATFTLEKNEDRYLLTAKNVMKQTGKYQGRIHLKTDNPEKPEIIISVSGIIRARAKIDSHSEG